MSKSVVLIDRDYILSALGVFNDTANGDWDFLTGIETAKEIVQNAPTIDAVEVVRCKDCKYGHAGKCNNEPCWVCGLTGHVTTADGYCDEGVNQDAESD